MKSSHKFYALTALTVVLTATAVIYAQKGKLGSSTKKVVDKYESAVSPSQTSTSKSVEGDKVETQIQKQDTNTPSPIFSSSRSEGDLEDPLQNLTQTKDFAYSEYVDNSIGDPLA